MTQSEKLTALTNKVLNNPKLVDKLPEETFIKFVICISKYNRSLAHKVFDLRTIKVSTQNKILFWEAVGLLNSLDGDMANEFNNSQELCEYVDLYDDGL